MENAANAAAAPWTFTAYCVFLCVCILSTLDSGYVALKWFFQEGVAISTADVEAQVADMRSRKVKHLDNIKEQDPVLPSPCGL